MADFGATVLLSRCNQTVDGILSKTHTDETTCEYKKTPDECGENVQGFTRNVMSTHEYEGEITGASPGGICDWTVGESETPPFNFSNAGGTVFVCTRARFSEQAGEYAKFSGSLDNSQGI
jgi:hypothetical protein